MTRAAQDLEYDKASKALTQLFNRQGSKVLGSFKEKMKEAFGVAQAEFLGKRLVLAVYDINETAKANAKPINAQDILTEIVTNANLLADKQQPKWSISTATEAASGADRVFYLIEDAHNKLCPGRKPTEVALG